jgi:lipoprotein NlpI
MRQREQFWPPQLTLTHRRKGGQVCEAAFYVGQLALQQNAIQEATRRFHLAATDCPRDFVEGPAASAELAALDIGQ